jgi:hypothetical protein
LPEVVTDDTDRRESRRRRRLRIRLRARWDLNDRLGRAVVIPEVAANGDRHLEQLENIRRCGSEGDEVRVPVLVDVGEVASSLQRSDAVEDGRSVADVWDVAGAGGEVDDLPCAKILTDDRQAIGVPVWQWSQEDGVHHAEDRGACADAECEGDDRGERERGTLAQRPGAERQVSKEGRHRYRRLSGSAREAGSSTLASRAD